MNTNKKDELWVARKAAMTAREREKWEYAEAATAAREKSQREQRARLRALGRAAGKFLNGNI